jgi:hypothetical protein
MQGSQHDNLIQRNQDSGRQKWRNHTSTFADTNDDANDEHEKQNERIERARCCSAAEF